MDWEYPGRRVNREMAFRLAMLAYRNACVSGEWGSEEAVWAVDHLVNEFKSISSEESEKEIVLFLQGNRYSRVEFVRKFVELENLWNEYVKYKMEKAKERNMWKVENLRNEHMK